MHLLRKARQAYIEGGVRKLATRTVNYIYSQIPISPYRYVDYNGVVVPKKRLMEIEDRPEYEKGLIEGLEMTIEEDDTIVILGGGQGVTAVSAARLCGDSSNVAVYEGSEKQVERIKATIEANGVEDIVVYHAVVGPEIDLWGSKGLAEHINASELPECDVLEMDVEGSEIKILEDINIRPRVLIVESHGMNGAPTSKVKELLKDMSYRIDSVVPAEDTVFARENDIMAVTGILE